MVVVVVGVVDVVVVGAVLVVGVVAGVVVVVVVEPSEVAAKYPTAATIIILENFWSVIFQSNPLRWPGSILSD